MSDLTIIICAYKATKELTLCLHQLAQFGVTKDELLIYENSPSYYSENRNLLNKYGIKYIDNPGGGHADTVNKALQEVKTKYALLLDSDCICLADPHEILQHVKNKGYDLFGDICGDRGGYRLHKRVHPWYCFMNVEFLKKHNIPFTDFKRVQMTNSMSFYDCKQLASVRDPRFIYYDVGSTMYEDVIGYRGSVGDIGERFPYWHKEGSSWYMEHGHQGFIRLGLQKDAEFENVKQQLFTSEEVLKKLA